MTALLLAALSAVLYGAGVAVEHRQAARTPAEAAGRPRMLALLARQPWWLAGVGLETAGFAAHAAALRSGSLAAVQMILGCSLLVSIAVTTGLTRRAMPRHCWPAICVVVAAVGASLALLGPGEHAATAPPGRVALAALVTGLITVPLAAAGLLATGRRSRPLLLALAAGLADTCAAVLTMAFAHSFAHGPGAVLTSWPVYALIAGELASLTLAQTTYQTDTPLITLPVITAVMPVASLTVGILALGETAHLSGTRVAIVTACLALAVGALVVLARSAATGDRASGGVRPAARRAGSRLGGLHHRSPLTSTYRNGTNGMMAAMAHTTFLPPLMSVRPTRSIQISTTAIGWRKQTRSSRTFFIQGNLPKPAGSNHRP